MTKVEQIRLWNQKRHPNTFPSRWVIRSLLHIFSRKQIMLSWHCTVFFQTLCHAMVLKKNCWKDHIIQNGCGNYTRSFHTLVDLPVQPAGLPQPPPVANDEWDPRLLSEAICQNFLCSSAHRKWDDPRRDWLSREEMNDEQRKLGNQWSFRGYLLHTPSYHTKFC